MPKKESAKRGYMTKDEVMSHLDGLKTDEGKAKYLSKILEKKGLLAKETYGAVQGLADEIYGKVALEAAEKNWFYTAGEVAEKAGNKKLANEMYGKAALQAAEQQDFSLAGHCAEKAGDKKLADEIYSKAALQAAEQQDFSLAGVFLKNIKDKKLRNEMYGKAAVVVAGGVFQRKQLLGIGAGEKFGFAGEWFEKAGMKKEADEIYGKHGHGIADYLERHGDTIKAKDLRRRLERGKKK